MPDPSSSPGLPQRLFRWLRSVVFYEHWMIGIVDQPIRNALQWTHAPHARWIAPADRKRFFADPFPWPGSADTLLCETLDIATRTGRIVALRIDKNKPGDELPDELPVDLPLGGHLSFPFLFTLDGAVHLMPESSNRRRLEIFRWHQDTGHWQSVATVFEDRPVADAVLFEKDGLLWIAFSDTSGDPHDNLHLIYAEEIAGPWREHAGNPVQQGRDKCRGAGPVFTADGRLFRPTQDCSRVYGGSLRIMEITLCTPAAYAEREVTHIVPSSRSYPDGIHTLAAWGDRCLIDGMRLTFSWAMVWRKIRRRLGLCAR